VKYSLAWLPGTALILSLCSAATAAPDVEKVVVDQRQTLGQALRKTVEENFQGYRDESLDKVRATIHSKSPVYQNTIAMTQRLFGAYTLKYTLVGFTFMGSDGEYAVARVKQKTEKIAGPGFRNNQTDTMAVFKKEDGKWKFWQQTILEIKYPPADAPKRDPAKPKQAKPNKPDKSGNADKSDKANQTK